MATLEIPDDVPRATVSAKRLPTNWQKYPPPPDVVCVPTDAAVEEIDAVGKLSFESDKLEGYRRIAARHNLDDTVQAYLVEAIFDNLSFESPSF